MADIEFDAGDASALAKAVRGAAATLRGQGGIRSGAAESALADFAGSYADRFPDAVVIEAEDRGKLVGVLTDLASGVDRAAQRAEQERERVRAHAAWKVRESERQRSAADALAGPFSGAAVDLWGTLVDREPSNEPLTRPTVDAEFRGRERARYGAGASRGKSSADPTALRAFVSTVAGLDTAASAEAARVRSAWSSFRSSCAWVQVDRGSMPAGFDRYVAENDEDRSWIAKTAKAFEDAGGGALADAVLDIAAMGRAAPAVQGLLAPGLTPTQVAAKWAALGLTTADADALRALPTSVLSELGNLEGIPYWARSTANVVVLNQRLGDVELEIESLLASVASTGDEGAARAAAQRIAALKTELKSLRNINATMAKKGAEGERYLISLTDDQPPLAAVSIGDLDTADSVTWAVPGMDTTTADMSSWTMAAQNIYDEQGRAAVDGGFSGTHAVVSWIGYDTPTPAEVLFMGKAKRGGGQLAESIRGLGAVRTERMPETNVVAHSYGTTTTAVALSQRGVHVDRFVALGSAGLPDTVDSADELHAGHVYAAQAKDAPVGQAGQGDEWAVFGRDHSVAHHVDPTSGDFGATVFGANGTTAADGRKLKPVLHHDPLNSDLKGYLDRDTETIYNVGRATIGLDDELTPPGSR
ncbi:MULTISPECIES: alpha/beta hydrolase [unclassified Curtobacterium]|uniref:alpha/beta hydrolase n=1 Tax=unclassified Curtobacterium TaxID=257496 RepID=UPI000F473A0D|nr:MULTISPECIES: alpha/beta hydrolase [unclassified Curtobacterium]ROQ06921.1 alpha/beta hydrolase family protein [Curtobacterium sp. PhB171]ROQ27847.1 alpha/beta hydrolase family protein [Curtobacterium sp. PhB170]ROS34776.1 alpha/beta hydrolase family protein [Curtobacterium sp. PhB131]ROS72857.1 alpha/beta hydrolase family protein [Curtobacterium sp. PhB141]